MARLSNSPTIVPYLAKYRYFPQKHHSCTCQIPTQPSSLPCGSPTPPHPNYRPTFIYLSKPNCCSSLIPLLPPPPPPRPLTPLLPLGITPCARRSGSLYSETIYGDSDVTHWPYNNNWSIVGQAKLGMEGWRAPWPVTVTSSCDLISCDLTVYSQWADMHLVPARGHGGRNARKAIRMRAAFTVQKSQ